MVVVVMVASLIFYGSRLALDDFGRYVLLLYLYLWGNFLVLLNVISNWNSANVPLSLKKKKTEDKSRRSGTPKRVRKKKRKKGGKEEESGESA